MILASTLRYRASASGCGDASGSRTWRSGLSDPNDFEAAFVAMKANKPDAILLVAKAFLTTINRKRVFDFALRAFAYRRSTSFRSSYEMAGLLSYGAGFPELFERAAALRCSHPEWAKARPICHLSCRRATSSPSISRTARAMGLDVPVMLLARADEVIE